MPNPPLRTALACALFATGQALAQSSLPPDPPTGFYARFSVDGRPVDQVHYAYRQHAFVVLPTADDPANAPLRNLWLDLPSGREAAVVEGIQFRVQDAFRLDPKARQSFTLTGAHFCKSGDEQPEKVVARATYARPPAGATRDVRMNGYAWRNEMLIDTDLDQDRDPANDHGFETSGPGLLGVAEGTLVITALDTAQQIIEGRFEFTAARHLTAHKDASGAWAGRCSEPGDFKREQVQVTRGEFRLRYCLMPMARSNSRTCPGDLSPEAPR